VNAPADLPPVRADSDRLAQVLQNLVTNALRHTPAGGRISLTAAATAQAGFVEFSVRDTGEGIPSAALPFVFDRFYRADEARARRSGGTGLGLAIAQSLVQTMGGAIGVESDPESKAEQGSRFWFTLPVAGE
jgi:signal transduction histidine kinase